MASMATEGTVVVASRPTRQQAEAVAADLLRNHIVAIANLSLHYAGVWNVTVLAGDADSALAMVKRLAGA
jgi:hypothetical protein